LTRKVQEDANQGNKETGCPGHAEARGENAIKKGRKDVSTSEDWNGKENGKKKRSLWAKGGLSWEFQKREFEQ